MDSAVILSARFGLLALMWVFILLVLWSQRKDVVAAAGAVRRQASASAPVAREKARSLAVIEGPLKGSHMEVASLEDFTVGRAGDNDFQLGDDFASSRHARLFRRGSEWFVEDLDSRNGTFVNGVRIDQPERVSVGTDMKMGRTIVRLMP
ncbi:FHA domain-containing protein [Corynebacterium sp. Marseille-P4321]|uniref:FHA domain-containing protein FhaB/FipA n=1 Tax=Corynebacterium sp. Marseille-P4321 TaxID=2736603 RepID=UPI000893C209|nr:FHA domain-containing protein [Corynebacterium sp. Marseille-P4321]OEX93195.1 FHA domain-containing protein [Corynebacterium sp. BCW_4722]